MGRHIRTKWAPAAALAAVALLTTTAQALTWTPRYVEDFNHQPDWETNSPVHHNWSPMHGAIELLSETASYGGFYGRADTGQIYDVMKLSFDMSIVVAEDGSKLGLGLFDEAVNLDRSEYIMGSFTQIGNDLLVALETRTRGGLYSVRMTQPGAIQIWNNHRFELIIDRLNQTVQMQTFDLDAQQLVASLQLSDIGIFSDDMTWLASTTVRDSPATHPGAVAFGHLDNAILSIPGSDDGGLGTIPEPLTATCLIGISCVAGYALRRRCGESLPN